MRVLGVLELRRELPHERIEKGESREGSGAYPDVDESIRVGVWDAWVTSVRVAKILLHFSSQGQSRSRSTVRAAPFFLCFIFLSLPGPPADPIFAGSGSPRVCIPPVSAGFKMVFK